MKMTSGSFTSEMKGSRHSRPDLKPKDLVPVNGRVPGRALVKDMHTEHTHAPVQRAAQMHDHMHTASCCTYQI